MSDSLPDLTWTQTCSCMITRIQSLQWCYKYHLKMEHEDFNQLKVWLLFPRPNTLHIPCHRTVFCFYKLHYYIETNQILFLKSNSWTWKNIILFSVKLLITEMKTITSSEPRFFFCGKPRRKAETKISLRKAFPCTVNPTRDILSVLSCLELICRKHSFCWIGLSLEWEPDLGDCHLAETMQHLSLKQFLSVFRCMCGSSMIQFNILMSSMWFWTFSLTTLAELHS